MAEKHTYTSLAGEPIKLSIPRPRGVESFYFMAAHKSGSVLFYNLVRDIAKAARQSEFALETELFHNGVILPNCPLELMGVLERPGYWFHGFRTPWLLTYIRRFRLSKKFLLVRDPRDICVSYYFSMAKSHTVPDRGEAREKLLEKRAEAELVDPNTFIKQGNADFILRNLRNYQKIVKEYGATVFRYEDYIFEKKKWINTIAGECGVKVPPGKVQEMLDKYDIVPDAEQPDQHIRQVTPGNYRKHLEESTIQTIERRFPDLFDFFKYEREFDAPKKKKNKAE